MKIKWWINNKLICKNKESRTLALNIKISEQNQPWQEADYLRSSFLQEDQKLLHLFAVSVRFSMLSRKWVTSKYFRFWLDTWMSASCNLSNNSLLLLRSWFQVVQKLRLFINLEEVRGWQIENDGNQIQMKDTLVWRSVNSFSSTSFSTPTFSALASVAWDRVCFAFARAPDVEIKRSEW